MTKKNLRMLMNKTRSVKGLLRNLENKLKDTPHDNITERAMLNAARQAVAAAEAELQSAVFSLETLEDMSK